MNAEIPENADSRSASFRQISDAFLSQDGLPFSEVLTAEKIQNAFGRNGGLFGMNDAYSTVIVVWAFLSHVKQRWQEPNTSFLLETVPATFSALTGCIDFILS